MTQSGVVNATPYNPKAFSLKPRLTPLQRIIGLYEAEEYYDLLDLPDQLIVDLLAEGWQKQEIAQVFNVNPSWISVRLRQVRLVLATTKLQSKIEIRQDTKDVLRGDL
jgi:hypothetical protein